MIKNIGNFKDKIDGTIKCVYEMENKKIVEMSVLYNKEDKDVVCVPTHHFCNLGCKMCHLTNKGLNKKMIRIEIDDFMKCLIETLSKYKTNKSKLLISFMGVGEPLLNIDLILNVFKNKDKIKELGYESVSYALSTMMPNDNLEKLSVLVNEYNIPLKVHFSLHTPIDSERKELIPSTRVNVSDALKLLSNYKNQVMKNEKIMDNYIMFHRNNIPVEIHYTLIKGVNDGNKELKCLINLLKEYNIPIKFIKFNETNTLKKSDNEEIWIKSLKEELPNLNIKSYSPPGRCVGSSCGEFTKHYYHYKIETKEELEKFLKWKKEYEI